MSTVKSQGTAKASCSAGQQVRGSRWWARHVGEVISLTGRTPMVPGQECSRGSRQGHRWPSDGQAGLQWWLRSEMKSGPRTAQYLAGNRHLWNSSGKDQKGQPGLNCSSWVTEDQVHTSHHSLIPHLFLLDLIQFTTAAHHCLPPTWAARAPAVRRGCRTSWVCAGPWHWSYQN